MSGMFDFLDLQEAAHQNSVAHGWYTTPEDKMVLVKLALVHSEITEAQDAITGPAVHFVGDKPCGWGIEFADVIIRIMDLCGFLKLELRKMVLYRCNQGAVLAYTPGQGASDYLLGMHRLVSRALECYRVDSMSDLSSVLQKDFEGRLENTGFLYELAGVVNLVTMYCGSDLNFWVQSKHSYNINRPYRHGGKRV